jgi:hypothetical protein
MLDRIPEFSDEQSEIYSYHSLDHWFPSDDDTPKRKRRRSTSRVLDVADGDAGCDLLADWVGAESDG